MENAIRDMYREFTADEILSRALKILQEGWTKGAFEDELGNFCMLGAMSRAVAGDAVRTPHKALTQAFDLINKAIQDYAEENGIDFGGYTTEQLIKAGALIPTFNDHERVGLEDVTMVMKRALHAAEEDDE